ncbi:MAG: pilus assembly protein [Hyphomicrobiales bacterium]|nr:pilus assembly protein [Alphaproteobacteria bacterium]
MVMNTSLKAMFARLHRTVRELRAANGANVTVTFALATIPMVGFVGAAVDYSHANSVKAAMQAAADSTALMLSKVASTENTASLQTKATSYFQALFNRPEATGLQVGATYTASGGSKVVVTATSNVKANFMGLMGVTTMKVGVNSQAAWGNTRLRVALALDTTGSMADDGKIDALQTATKSLLSQLKAAASQNGDVYVSIIPFSRDVNWGAANYQSTALRWDLWDEVNGSCSNNNYDTKSDCQSHNKTWTTKNHNTWNGCIADRDQNYDTTNSAPSTSVNASLFPAEQYGSCPAQLIGLTYDWNALNSKVDDLYPSGNTNQGIGIAWAFQSLTASPFTIPAKDPNYTYKDIIILMSDGLNTQNRFSSNQTSIDTRESITCTNAKNAGITVYTVQVNTGGDPTQNVMKNCASSADKFTEIKSANQLVATFNSIGTALSNLRISQ